MRRRSLLLIALCAGLAAACQLSPLNGQTHADVKVPFTFAGASVYANDTLQFQVQNQQAPSTWATLTSATTSATPDATDVSGVQWYVGIKESALPVHFLVTPYWRFHAGSGATPQHRISADFRTWSTKQGTALASFDASSAADTCRNTNFEQRGGLAVIESCTSGRSPEAQLYLNCGRADQACCLSYQASLLCNPGRSCDLATSLCSKPAGGEGQPCNDDLSCNGSLVCGADHKCVNATTATTRWFTADQQCAPGSSDCNVCAPNVRAQFDRAGGNDQWFETLDLNETMRWHDAQWNFNWRTNYWPSGRTPNNVFGQHVQGFVRTNNDRLKYAATYSNDEGDGGGAIIFIEQNSSGVKHMVNMIGARHRHPSGMSVFGKYLLLSDVDDEIRVVDINRRAENHVYSWHAPQASRAGGGLGMAKLNNGSRLLVVSPKGDDGAGDRWVKLYHVTGNIEAQPTVKMVGNWKYAQPSSWSGDYRYTENLSVISECGTGDIYVVNVSGNGITAAHRGYWLLSKVVQKKDAGLTLEPIKAFFTDQTQARCSTRSSGTVWVSNNGNIELLCSERSATGFAGDDTIRFKYGSF